MAGKGSKRRQENFKAVQTNWVNIRWENKKLKKESVDKRVSSSYNSEGEKQSCSVYTDA